MSTNDDYINRFKVLLDAYFATHPSLSDAQDLLRTVMSQASYSIIGAHMNEILSTGGNHPIGPHLEADPVFFLTAAALRAEQAN
jgi:hypothetical protein